MEKLIIEARVNEYATRDKNKNVPWTPDELAQTAEEVEAAGASIMHFHPRTPDGSPEHHFDVYAEIIRKVRNRSNIMLHPTLGQITVSGVEERLKPIKELVKDPSLKPDICPIDCGSTNIDIYDPINEKFLSGEKTYINRTSTLVHFANFFSENNILPCLIAWTTPFVRTIDALIKAHVIKTPAYVTLYHTDGWLLGGQPPTPESLRSYLDVLPAVGINWSVACKGGNLMSVAASAIQKGGHVAIGIGDYPYNEIGEPTNAQLIRKIVDLARLMGREIATPSEARKILGVDE